MRLSRAEVNPGFVGAVNALRHMVSGSDVHAQCPDCSAVRCTWDLIWHINDRHGWTREQIADWLDGLGLDLAIHTEYAKEPPPWPSGWPV